MSPRSVHRCLLAVTLLLAGLLAPSAAQAAAPTATVPPAISGQYRVGQVLTTTNGSWTPSSGVTYVVTWERCAGDGTDCTSIGGVSGVTYTLTAADHGSTIRSKVSATNIDGTTVAFAPVTPVVAARQPPAVDQPPVVSGSAYEGQTLTVSDGTWTGPGSPKVTARQWQRCRADGTGCVNIPGGTAATYKLVVADIGSRVRVDVTASSSDGATHAFTDPTEVVEGVAPINTGQPTLTGTLREGQVLKIGSNGTWTGTLPQTATFRWERCTAAGELPCDAIGGATTNQYTLTAADVGRTVRGVVTMTNTTGATSAPTLISVAVAPKAPPVVTTAPSIGGTPVDGQTLTAADGDWTGTPTITKTRVWQRCDGAGSGCLDTASTGPTLKLVSGDVGDTFRLKVTAKNDDGQTVATSAATAPVAGVAPANTVLPTLSGTFRDGQQVKVQSTGAWDGTTPLTPAYRWERCTATGEAPCDVIAGATAGTYTLTLDDVGRTVRAVVTMANTIGSASAATAISAKVDPKAPPVMGTAPQISGDAIDGQTLTAADGTWTGTATIATTRVWQRCDAAGDDCADTTTTATSLKLAATDIGSSFRIRVTAKNADGETVRTSAATAAVGPALPVNTKAPAITGTLKDGQVLTATPGTWSGTATLTYGYQWQRCAGTTCSDIPLATGATYRLTTADIAATIKVAVVATNDAGPGAAALSPATASVTAGPPVAADLPQISGTYARDGSAWSATIGDWKGTDVQSYERQWLRCAATGASCTPITGQTGTTYTLAAADVGKTVRVEVTAFSAYGSTKAQSAASPVVVALRPEIDGAVTLGGTLRDGQVVSAESTWTGTAPVTLTYQWQRCVVTCVDIIGAGARTYTLTSADVAARVKVKVFAANGGGTGVAESGESASVMPDAPASSGAPVLVGTAREGAQLTTSTGTFTGTTPLTHTYAWERCSNVGDACAAIDGATAATYTLTADDRGRTVRAIVTATNDAGAASHTTPVSAIVALAPPVNTIVPAVSPNTGLRDGALLTATSGAWSGSAPMDITYRWQRCNLAGTTCADIAGAGEPTYRAGTADVGFTLRAVVTATNGGGFATKASLITGVVGTNPPTNDALPTIAIDGGGPTRDGATLRTTIGDWRGLVPMTPSYEWWRCDPAGENCSPIEGATASSYQLTPADVGLRVRARVTQTNAGGSTAALSAASAAVVAAPPVNQVRPQIVGGAALGKTLSATPGVWTGTPELDFDYVWERCDADGQNCAPIPGAEAATYKLTEADTGLTLRVQVTAENGVGSDVATSLTTLEVQDQPPVKITNPTISAEGLVAHGRTLTVDPGTWGGAQPVDFTYQWRRCDVALVACTDIGGAAGTTYQLTKDDVGKRILVVVTATNVVDVATAQTDATPTVLPEPPANTVLPTIGATGGVRDGSKLTVTNGNWTGAAPITFAVVWLRCDADGNACLPISEVPSPTYTLTSEDVGARIRIRVTATNAATSVSAQSNPTSVVAAAPPNATTRPSVLALDGKAQVGGRLKGVVGVWAGTNPMTTSYRWQRCAASSTAACDDVPGATGTEYVLTTDDVGKRLRLVVTATNAGGTVVAESQPSDVVPAIPPDSAGTPAIAGGPHREGGTLSATPGAWSGSQPMTIAYQWERCKEAGATTCAKIAGATSATYTLASADVGSYVRVAVTAVNAGGKASKASVPVGSIDGLAPVNVSPPVASAKGVKVGGMLSVTNGKWAGTATIKYEYRWQRCNAAGTSCQDLDGGTKATYKLTAEDVNGTLLSHPMRAVVVGTNIAGSAEAASQIVGTARDGLGIGAAGDDAAGVAAGGKKKGGGTTKHKVPAALKGVKAMARLKKLSLSSKGKLTMTLSCDKRAKTACGVIGTIAYKKAIAFDIQAGPIKKGKTAKVSWTLTKGQRAQLKGRKSITFRLRMAAPTTQSLAKVMKRKVAVPKKLRGKVAKKKSAKKKKKASSKTKTSSRTKTSSKTKTKVPPTTTTTPPPTTTTPSTTTTTPSTTTTTPKATSPPAA